jgi:gamma-glutamylcyclotransferase (GGCT)/AIG2-like uncharacterized protein YtfP
MRLFLYGTLLDPALLARFAGRPIPLIPATLHGWRRVALPGGRYPTLRRMRGMVIGAVATVDGRTLARLTAYEGPAYRLRPLIVSVARRKTVAQAWIAPSGTRLDWP